MRAYDYFQLPPQFKARPAVSFLVFQEGPGSGDGAAYHELEDNERGPFRCEVNADTGATGHDSMEVE